LEGIHIYFGGEKMEKTISIKGMNAIKTALCGLII
jgi:hypothetical protein